MAQKGICNLKHFQKVFISQIRFHNNNINGNSNIEKIEYFKRVIKINKPIKKTSKCLEEIKIFFEIKIVLPLQ